MAEISDATASASARKTVLYCNVCGFPPEYCEFGLSLEKCKAWLRDEHPDVFVRLFEQSLEGSMNNLSVNDDKKTEKLAAKEAAKKEREEKKKRESRITIKRSERNKRKVITSIHGLEVFDVDLKRAAKLFANKFACGASVTKNNQGQDEIAIQGDFSDEVFDLILENWKAVPEDNIDQVEDKPAKKTKPLPPPQQRPA